METKTPRAKIRGRLLAAFMLAAAHQPAAAQEAVRFPGFGFGAATRAPIGYRQMCEREPAFCADDKKRYQPEVVVLDETAKEILEDVNFHWNQRIKPMTDSLQYGAIEVWEYPPANDMGDCEEYVLAKRQNLIARGFPRQTLLITVVRDKNDEGHAVLTVMTDKGMLVLDNLTDEISSWKRTGYVFHKVQHPAHPYTWAQITAPPEAGALVALPQQNETGGKGNRLTSKPR